eukprot:SAG22_NODE_440_length_10484_cov_19.751661_13_plen_263_part_01
MSSTSAMVRDTISRLQGSFRQHKVKVEEAFMAFDKTNSGEISRSEFRGGMSALQIPISDRDVDRVMEHFDKDGDGKISKAEFVAEIGGGSGSGSGRGGSSRLSEDAVKSLKKKFQDANIKLDQAFLAFDENNDGEISSAEFRRGLRAMQMKLTDREVDDLIKHFDSDGDGRISLQEFVRVFNYSGGGPSGGGGGGGGGGSKRWQMPAETLGQLQRKFRDHGVNIKQAFLAFDDNNDGMISPAEFRRGIAAMQMNLLDQEVEDL